MKPGCGDYAMTESSMLEFYRLLDKVYSFARYHNEPIYATHEQIEQIRKINPWDSPELFAPGYYALIPPPDPAFSTEVKLVDKLEDSTIYKYQNREKND